jgi:hypothetical protein
MCRCPGNEPACRGGELGGCCLEEDTCDLDVGCVTETCSAQNDFNSLAWASCNDNSNCWCFSRLEDEAPACAAAYTSLSFCEREPGCLSDDDYVGDAVCFDVSWCPNGPTPGACLTLCAAP